MGVFCNVDCIASLLITHTFLTMSTSKSIKRSASAAFAALSFVGNDDEDPRNGGKRARVEGDDSVAEVAAKGLNGSVSTYSEKGATCARIDGSKGRRIVRASRKSKKNIPSLKSDEVPANLNPFANISFASSNTTAYATSNSGGKVASHPACNPASSASSVSKSKKLNRDFLQMIADHWGRGYYWHDYSALFVEYANHASDTIHNDSALPNETSPRSENGNDEYSFTFCNPVLEGVSKEMLEVLAAEINSDEWKAKAKNEYFGFTNQSMVCMPSTGRSNKFRSTYSPDENKTVKIGKKVDEVKERVLELRARAFKRIDSKWGKCGSGMFRLYHNCTTGKQHMAIWNETGRVQLNLAISNGMEFTKVVKKSEKDVSSFVRFGAKADATQHVVDVFMLQVKPESLDHLHSTLKKMVGQ